MEIKQLNTELFEKYKKEIALQIQEFAVLNFENNRINDNYGESKCNDIDRYLNDGSAIIYVAIEDEKLLGWIWCHTIMRFETKMLHIPFIIVSKEYRGKKIGKALLEKVEDYARNNGYEGMDLLVSKSNDKAVNFYKNSEFEEERILMTKRFG